MNYQETINWMFGRLPVYQHQGKSAFSAKLDGIKAFSNQLDNPQKTYKTIHVAGTNGKGSTSHMIASILQEAGYKVGLYTSPHLKDFRERIKINGEEISQPYVINFISEQKQFLQNHELSFFEMTVGMAFAYFAQKNVDVAIIEVGLGGRLDATNIITPEVSVITNIGLDHTDILGDTLEKIAKEKAGIIKQSIPVVIGEYQEETFPVFQQIVKEKNAPLTLVDELVEKPYELDLLGLYQLKNSKTAIAVARTLSNFTILEQHIEMGLKNVIKNTKLYGRWQVIKVRPKVICDTAHNREGLFYTMEQLKKEHFDVLHIVLGVVSDKKLDNILSLFPKNAQYYFCKPAIKRGLDAVLLEKKAADFNLKGNVFNSVTDAYKASLKKASSKDVIYIGGSTFVVAEIL